MYLDWSMRVISGQGPGCVGFAGGSALGVEPMKFPKHVSRILAVEQASGGEGFVALCWRPPFDYIVVHKPYVLTSRWCVCVSVVYTCVSVLFLADYIEEKKESCWLYSWTEKCVCGSK